MWSKEKAKQYVKKYYRNLSSEKKAERQKKVYIALKKFIAKMSPKELKAYREKKNKCSRKWYSDNKRKSYLMCKKWREDHRERFNELCLNYKNKHRDKINARYRELRR